MRRWPRAARIAAVVIAGCMAVRLAPFLAPIRVADLRHDGQSIEFVDRSGLPLGTVLSRDQEHTAFVALGGVSRRFIEAIVAAEDGRYDERGPVDAAALARAAWQAIEAHHVVSGGSTIPMQLARMLYGLPSTPLGKAEQIWYAWRIAAGSDRDAILDAYVNRLPMGGNVYGVEAASRTYFGVDASDLDLAQASLLAALPNDPIGLDPYAHMSALRERQQYVLDRMVAARDVSSADAERAAREHVALAPRRQGLIAAEHFLFYVAGQTPPGTARVTTTIDRPLQQFVEEQMRQVMATLASRDAHAAAAIVIDNTTGDVLAYVGSPDYFDDADAGRNDGVQALRQPGSALKPFLYEQALETRVIRPNTILADAPVHFALPNGLLYSPSDYSDTYQGPVRVRIALADSLNVPALRVLSALGVASFLDRLHELGFVHLDKPADYYGLGLTLGGGEVSLWELARAYATMARDGVPVALDTVLPHPSPPAAAVTADVGSAPDWELVTDMLADAHARARAFGVSSALSLPFPAAVKTGTSSDFRDTWTVGFTPEYTVGVWVGNFDGSPMHDVSGVAGAAPLWNRIMLHLYEQRDPAPFSPPEGMVRRPICAATGDAPAAGCRSVVLEYLDEDDVAAYGRATPPPSLGGEYDAWLAIDPASAESTRFKIVQPADGSVFLRYAGAAAGQRLGFVTAGAPNRTTDWTLNGRRVGSSTPEKPFFWSIVPGSYRLVARSGSQIDAVTFTVRAARHDDLPRGFVAAPETP